MSAPFSTPKNQWRWIAAIWLSIGLFDATQNVFVMRAEGMHHAWDRLVFTLLVCWTPWALATPFILNLGRRYPPTQLRPISAWARHIAACIAIGLAFSALGATLEVLLNPWAKVPGP